MIDPIRILSVGALALGALLFAAPARADLILTADGKWHPSEGPLAALTAADDPNGEQLQAAIDNKADAGYDTVKLSKGFSCTQLCMYDSRDTFKGARCGDESTTCFANTALVAQNSCASSRCEQRIAILLHSVQRPLGFGIGTNIDQRIGKMAKRDRIY